MDATRVGKLRYWLAGIAAVILLGVTHWLAYREGEKAEHDKFAGFVQDTLAVTPPDLLRADVTTMRLASAHPGSLSEREMQSHISFMKARLTQVEKISIPYAQKTGNTDQQKRWEEIALSAHAILDKMPKQ
jgi:hypothetical protein